MPKINLAFILFSSLFFIGFNNAEDQTYIFNFEVSNESEVVIGGTTNVNEFTCDYLGKFQQNDNKVTGYSKDLNLYLKDAIFILEVSCFDCHNRIMTSEFQETLKAEEFPRIEMEIIKLSFKNEKSFNSGNTELLTHLKVMAAGKTKIYQVKTERRIGQNSASFSGNFDLLIEDFGIEAPSKAFGLVKVNSTLNIDYKLIFSDSKNEEAKR